MKAGARVSRRTVLAGMAAATTSGAPAFETGGSEAGDGGANAPVTYPVTYPAGFRLGIVVPPTLEPNVTSNSPRDLLSADHTLRVGLHEPPFFDDERQDALTWSLDNDDREELVREWQPAPDEWRRLFVDRRYGESTDYGGRTLLIYRDRWFGRIDVSIGSLAGAMRSENGQLARWSDTVDALLASATVRAPVDVPQFMAEHAIALDANGLYPRHFATKLVLSPRAPQSGREAWSMDDRVVMESPPAPLERDEMMRDYPDLMDGARETAERAWTANGIEWFARPALTIPLKDGTMRTRTVVGYGPHRSVEWTAYAHSDVEATFAALDRVVASFRFTDDG